MPDLNEMIRAGFTPKKSGIEQISSIIQGAEDYTDKRTKQHASDLQDQTKLYIDLRNQGYTKEDAASRVNRTYRSTQFVQKILTGQDQTFSPGTDPDQVEVERTKATSEAKAKSAEAAQKLASARRMNALADNPGADYTASKQAEEIRKTMDTYIKTKYPTIAGGGTPSKQEKAEFDADRNIPRYQRALERLLMTDQSVKKNAPNSGKMYVKRKSDGQTGWISKAAFEQNQDKYEAA